MEGGHDRISHLPDELLEHLLSFQPSKHAVRTGVLSKRWKDLWVSSPHISLIDDYELISRMPWASEFKKFVNFLDKVFLHPQARIKKLQILSQETLDDLQFTRWFQPVMKDGLEELDLDFVIWSNVPLSIFTTCQTLVTLKLDFGMVSRPKFPKSFWFPNLKTMHLMSFTLASNFTDQLLQCQKLESLVLWDFMFDLMSNDPLPNDSDKKEALPNLNNAQMNCLFGYHHYFVKNMIHVMSNAKNLKLSLGMMEYLAGFSGDLPRFNNLKHIEVYLQFLYHVKALCYILQRAPKIESLHIEFVQSYGFENNPVTLQQLRSCCSSANLKIIRMMNFILDDLVLEIVQSIFESAGSVEDIIIELNERPRINTWLRYHKLLKLPTLSEGSVLHVKWNFDCHP